MDEGFEKRKPKWNSTIKRVAGDWPTAAGLHQCHHTNGKEAFDAREVESVQGQEL